MEKLTPDRSENRGTSAGGQQTNINGKSFEQKTANECRLVHQGFVRKTIPGATGKYAYYLEKGEVVYLTQGGLQAYFKFFFEKELCRCPDEAYLIRYESGNLIPPYNARYILRILEKKYQSTAGSVDTKLLAGPGFIAEYEFSLGPDFTVEYAFCINAYLQNYYSSESLKYRALRFINEKYCIKVFYGEEPDYYEHLDVWIAGPLTPLKPL